MGTEKIPNSEQGLSNSSIVAFVISGIVLLIAIGIYASSVSQNSKATTPQATQQPSTVITPPQAPPKTTCVDVTTYDHNWNNDVRCTKPDGTVFYTNYAGGRSNDATFTH